MNRSHSIAPSIAIVHEWLATYAGSERVVEQMLRVFPDADVFSLVDFLPAEHRGMLGGRRVTTSFIQRLPLARRAFRAYLPLMALAIEQLDLSRYDIVLSSSHAVAKGVLTRADQLHISYVHTPIRYAWDLQHEYLAGKGWRTKLRNFFARPILHYLRMWDRLSADRADFLIANSEYIARRIHKSYRRAAHVIYPPVDVDRFSPCDSKDNYYLAASRLVPYKKIDLIVEAFREMPDRRLVVIGDGPQYKQLARRATPNITLLGYQDHAVLLERMQKAKALVFAADEDFGILPVEAQACGTPVIAFGRGGVCETVLDGRTGLFFDEQMPQSIIAAVDRFERQPPTASPTAISEHAQQFSAARFCRELEEFVLTAWRDFHPDAVRTHASLAATTAALESVAGN
jgi:glycosyltransferase involved in cell wall biosynthesis